MSDEQFPTSLTLKYPLYTVLPRKAAPDDQGYMGFFQDLSTGDYLALVFLSKETAGQFIYLQGLGNHEIREISNESRFVHLCRQVMAKEPMIRHVVFDYVGAKAQSTLIEAVARIRIPEDLKHDSKINTSVSTDTI